MAVYGGCNAKIVIKQSGPGDPELIVSELNSYSINYSFTGQDFRAIGAYYPNRGISAADWTLSLSGYFDNLDNGQNLLNAGALRYFEIYPNGDLTPNVDPVLSGLCYIESLDTSGSPDDLIPLSISAKGTSELEAINTFIGEQF